LARLFRRRYHPGAGGSGRFLERAAIVQNKDGTSLRLEVYKAKNLQECKNRAMAAYAHLPGPIFCQHITHVELIDVYGNASPIE
jgi:hypothetical protein